MSRVLNKVTAVGVYNQQHQTTRGRSFQLTNEGTLGACSVRVEVSNDLIGWVELMTISLTAGLASDGGPAAAAWDYVRGNVLTINAGAILSLTSSQAI